MDSEEYERQEELQKKSVSPMLKPTPGKNMFNFGNFDTSPDKKSSNQMPMSPDNEAIEIQGSGGKRPQVSKLSLGMDDSEELTYARDS